MQSVSVKELSCQRGMRIIFKNINIHAKTGDVTLLCGKNGCGKTSLLKIIAGLIPQYSGEISINSDDIFFIDSKTALRNALTIKENLEFWASMLNGNEQNINKAINVFELDNISDKDVGELSSGQVKRTSLARLMLSNKKIWLLDEPENTLDTEFLNKFIKIVEDHVKNDGIAIIASHRPELWKEAKIVEVKK